MCANVRAHPAIELKLVKTNHALEIRARNDDDIDVFRKLAVCAHNAFQRRIGISYVLLISEGTNGRSGNDGAVVEDIQHRVCGSVSYNRTQEANLHTFFNKK